jgi:hypothetical protein
MCCSMTIPLCGWHCYLAGHASTGRHSSGDPSDCGNTHRGGRVQKQPRNIDTGAHEATWIFAQVQDVAAGALRLHSKQGHLHLALGHNRAAYLMGAAGSSHRKRHHGKGVCTAWRNNSAPHPELPDCFLHIVRSVHVEVDLREATLTYEAS